MTYARIENGQVVEYPVYQGEIRLRFPLCAFGQGEYFEAPEGYVPVVDAPAPEADFTKNIVEGAPVLVEGQYHRSWLVSDATAEEVTARLAARRALIAPISDRQFFQQLAIMGHITEAEALDAVGPGILPASMLSLIEMLPVEQQFSTKIILTGATSFERNHPLTPVLGGMFGMDDLALDDLWQAARLL